MFRPRQPTLWDTVIGMLAVKDREPVLALGSAIERTTSAREEMVEIDCRPPDRN